MAMKPEVLDEGGEGFGDKLVAYYHYIRRNDIFPAYAVLPPQAARNPEF